MLQSKYLLPILIVFPVFLILSGCFTTPGNIAFDPDLPPDRTTLVTFEGTIKVLEYNGIDVSSQWYPKDIIRANKVTLPAGSTKVLFNLSVYIHWANATIHVTHDNLELNFDFEPGKQYTLGGYVKNTGFLGLGKTKVGVGIWDSTILHRHDPDKAIKYWELAEI